MKTVDQMLIFDADGVLTNVEKEVVTEPLILDYIKKILEKGEPVAFNTGRGIDWVQETLITPLKSMMINKEILENLFIVAESGGINATFGQDGSLEIEIDESFKMPADLDQEVRDLVSKKYSKSMRYEDKKTLITTKIREGAALEDYHRDQLKIVEDLQKLIEAHGLGNELKTHVTTIGTDIMRKTAGKAKGIEIILRWLSEKKIDPQKFITFGDSESDVPMAEKLNEEKKTVELVYVGKNPLKENYPFPIRQTERKFEKGTLEFLKSVKFS